MEQIAWAIVALTAIISATVLLLKGVIKSGSIDWKGNRLEIGSGTSKKPLSQTDQAMLAMASLTDRKYQTANEVRAAQKRKIEDYYDRFQDIMHDADYFPAEVLWRHWTDPLVNAAEENHILSRIDKNGNIDKEYLAEKMLVVQSRYSRIMSRQIRTAKGVCEENCLPPWDEIETPLEILMAACINDFASIARKGWGSFKSSVEDARSLAPRMGFLLDRLVEGL